MVHLTALHSVLLFAACGAVAAQEPTPKQRFERMREQLVADAKAQLQAEDLTQVAWGARAVAEYRLTECIPELRARLSKLASSAGDRDAWAAINILDAMLQTGADVPGEELTPFLKGWAYDPALMLLGQRAAQNRARLLDEFRQRHPLSEGALACGCWLTELADRDFLRELLRARVQLDVLVTDTDEDMVESVQMVDSLCLSHYRPSLPAGFPPNILHHLEVHWVDGVSSVSTRREVHAWGFCLPSNPYALRIRSAPNAWFRRFLGDRAKVLTIDRAPLISAKWKGADAMLATIAARRAKIEAEHEALVAACVQANLIAADDALRTVPIVVNLVDVRTETEVALPGNETWKIYRW